MGSIKTFLLGVGTAFAVYYVTRKRRDGRSILDDVLENPAQLMETAKNYAVAEAVQVVKDKLS